jgi:hypothetical protein
MIRFIITLVLILVSFMMTTALALAVSDVAYRLPGIPALDVDPPHAILTKEAGALYGWNIDQRKLDTAIAYGKSIAKAKKQEYQALSPWRVWVDEGGEYVTILNPMAVASLLGYQAEYRSWSEATLQEKLTKAKQAFSSGICLFVELRSFAHEGRGFGRSGEIRPGSPGEAYDASFLLDAGTAKIDGISSNLQPERFGLVSANSSGITYQKLSLPEVSATKIISKIHTTGDSFGANYYIWWSFDAELSGAFKPSIVGCEPLHLTIITPTRKREFTIPAYPSIQ